MNNMCSTKVHGKPCKREGREWHGYGATLMCGVHWRIEQVRLEYADGSCEITGCANVSDVFGEGWYLCEEHSLTYVVSSWEQIREAK